jgi:hypothetical protein
MRPIPHIYCIKSSSVTRKRTCNRSNFWRPRQTRCAVDLRPVLWVIRGHPRVLQHNRPASNMICSRIPDLGWIWRAGDRAARPLVDARFHPQRRAGRAAHILGAVDRAVVRGNARLVLVCSLQQEARIVVEALIAIRDVAWRRGHEVGDGVGREAKTGVALELVHPGVRARVSGAPARWKLGIDVADEFLVGRVGARLHGHTARSCRWAWWRRWGRWR